MAIGTVKFFNAERGYGFLAIAGGEEVFLHASALRASGIPDLREGQRLEFLIERDDHGRTRAVDLKIIA